MIPPKFIVIGFQIGKLHRGAESAPPALPDSKKPGLFRVYLNFQLFANISCTSLQSKSLFTGKSAFNEHHMGQTPYFYVNTDFNYNLIVNFGGGLPYWHKTIKSTKF